MKIVDRTTFLAMPAGTVFSKYQPCVFDELCIKEETLPTNDFLVQYLVGSIESTDCGDFSAKLDHSQQHGASLQMDFDCLGRDGCFDDEQLFAIWERADVEALIGRLKATLENS